MEELQMATSYGFAGYRYHQAKHLLLPIVPDGKPSQALGGQNLYHDSSTFRTFPGCEKVFDTQLGAAGKRRVLAIYPHVKADGTIYSVICTVNKVYCYKVGDATPTDITPAGGLSDADYWSATYWASTTAGYVVWTILSNGVDVPIYWAGDPGTKCVTPLSAGAPVCKWLSNFKNHIFASYVKSGANYYMQRDQRCNVDDPTDWAAGLAGSADMRQAPGAIIGSLVFGDMRFVIKEYSTSLCRPTGYSPPFAYDQEVLPIGSPAPATITKVWKYDMGTMLGSDLNFYLLMKDGSYKSVGDNITFRLRDWANDQKLKYSFVVYYPGIDQILLAVPSSDHATNYCDKVFAFDLGHYLETGEAVWSTPITTGLYLSAGATLKFRNYYTLAQLADMYATIDDIPGTIGSLYQDAAFSEMIVGDANGYIYRFHESLDQFNGVDIPWEIETMDYKLTQEFGEYSRFQEYELFYRQSAISASVSISTDGGNTFDTARTIDMSGVGATDEQLVGRVWPDVMARKHRMKVSGTGRANLIGQRFFFTPEGRF